MNEIRSARVAAGLSQSELARRSGVAQPNVAAYESGRRSPSVHMLDRLQRACQPLPREALSTRRAEVILVLQTHGLHNPQVFGSVARADDQPGSDVDLVVDVTDSTDLLDLVDAADALEKLLGVHVDLVTSRSLRPDHEIRRTMVPL